MSWATATRAPKPLAPTRGLGRFEFPPAVVDYSKLVAVDFETYFDNEYTLTKLSTSEYVRDKRFEAQMCGIKVGDQPTVVPVGKKAIAEALDDIDWSTHSVVCHHTHFDGLILSHHFGVVPRFYYCTLSMARAWLSNYIGGRLEDVSRYLGGRGKADEGRALYMMKGLHVADMHPEVIAKGQVYGGQDTEEALFIFHQLIREFPQTELDLIDATVQMFTCPVLRLDEARARKALEQEKEERKNLILEVAPEPIEMDVMEKGWRNEYIKLGVLTPEGMQLFLGKKMLGSNPRFAAMLEAEGIDPPLKISPTWLAKPEEERLPEKQFIYAFAATDPAMQELLEDDNPRVRALCEARIAVKSNINITRAERLLRSGAGGRAMPVYYKFAAAHTMRFGGGDSQNWQNFKRGGELRKSIKAPEGHLLVIGDSRQIEARVNAWLWGQDDLVEAFRNGVDIYSAFAGENIYGHPVDRKRKVVVNGVETYPDELKGFVGKTAVLGLGYQMGAKKFRITLARGTQGPAVHVSEEEAQMVVNAYRRRYPMVVRGWAICEAIISDMAAGIAGEYKCLRWEKETLWLPNGMRLKYPGLKRSDEDGGWTYRRKDNVSKIYGGLLCENIVQALARIIVAADQLLALSKRWSVVMMTHDEMVLCVLAKFAEAARAHMLQVMDVAPIWAPGLPVSGEVVVSPIYSK